MPLQLGVQFNIILYGLLAGILSGILFDIYRNIRGFNVPKIIMFVQDILFCIFCSIFIFTFLLYMNYAFLTYHVYIFCFISLLIYFKFVSKFVVIIQKKFINKIIVFFRVIIKSTGYIVKIILSKLGIKNN
ncbi:MAG: spore cortex biosynthesis protein YabQ [Clostridiales bacterium]|nr:spore cortex biosynthesis protein YabQ [Clostridiales bacterium]